MENTEMLRRIALANAETADILIAAEGMKAANAQAQLDGCNLIYTQQDFDALRNLTYIHNLLQP